MNKSTSSTRAVSVRREINMMNALGALCLAVCMALISAPLAPALANDHKNHNSTDGGMTPREYAIPSSKATEALLLDVARAGTRIVAVGEFRLRYRFTTLFCYTLSHAYNKNVKCVPAKKTASTGLATRCFANRLHKR